MRAEVSLRLAQGANSRGSAARRGSGNGGAALDANGDGLSSDEGHSKGENGESGEAEHSGDGTGSECVQRWSVTRCRILDVGWLGVEQEQHTRENMEGCGVIFSQDKRPHVLHHQPAIRNAL